MQKIKESVAGDCRSNPSHIYISRRFAPKRRLVQEPEIEAIFDSLGFLIIYPEHTPLVDQIRLFASASCVAGTVGSGLYNVAYSRPGTQRIILAPDTFFTPNDLLLSAGLGVAPTYLFGTSLADPTQAMFADWSIDVSAVKKILPDLISSPDRKRIAICD
jgi:capsular polysaccharide biosynthesis protein